MRLTEATRIATSLLCVALHPFILLWYLQFTFESGPAGDLPFSVRRWEWLAHRFSFSPWLLPAMGILWGTALLVLCFRWLVGSFDRQTVQRIGLANAASTILVLQILLTYFLAEPFPVALQLLAVLTPTLASLYLSLWLAGHWLALFPSPDQRRLSTNAKVGFACLVYVIIFSTLAILQYRALKIPHGDTAMYEEHLWNFLQGKGFRSQLDDGRLFLGEHFQVIHLLLLPIYYFHPTLETLNVCQSFALGVGLFAVVWLGRSFRLSESAIVALALAYLLYFPLQYLNLELQWKTYRPTTFGVPLLLFALAAMEAGRYRLMVAMLSLSLLVKEEYAIAVAGVGVYLMLRRHRGAFGRREIFLGSVLTFAAGLFLFFVMTVLIPYYRGGEPHYGPYFSTLRANPQAAFLQVIRWESLRLLLLLLAPMGFLPFASPLRLGVSLPFFAYLMLADADRNLTEPFFHFHAPLVPLLWWAAVGGLKNLSCCVPALTYARTVTCLCLVTGVWYGKSPVSWKFYDPLEGVPRRPYGAVTLWEPMGIYWRDLYLPDERSATSFPAAFATVNPADRVAATDYVRARFTQFRAAHDYPRFRGHVTIDDIDVIFLDRTEGWWGRGPSNPDRELLQVLDDPRSGEGTELEVRGRPFRVVYHDPYFLVVRKVESLSSGSSTPSNQF